MGSFFDNLLDPLTIMKLVVAIGLVIGFRKAGVGMWRELNDSLEDEGGLLGRKPTPRELERRQKHRKPQRSSMTSEARPVRRPRN